MTLREATKMNTGSDCNFLRIWSIIRAGEADLERPDEAAGGDGAGAAEPGGPAEGRAVHAEPVQAPAGAREEAGVPWDFET